ncbi:MAG: Rpn family recombination-promoting nuclease/putative transposase [Prevotellaceae bacterium]|jgi:predicted transposase/invertase (TIGR01784 family)|nr:Rpn family recombination-promoting nuclease/putative transposase [Prevotellaceae bacterium]
MDTTKNTTKSRVLISFDYALKRLLRNKANYDVLEGFLSELLMRDVKVKSIGESEGNQLSAEDKYNRVDVMVEESTGEVIIIELQFAREVDYFHRMLYGASKVVTERIKRGENYVTIPKVYSINIIYFDLGQGEDYVYRGRTCFVGLHRQDELQLSAAQRHTFGSESAGDIYPEYYILKTNTFNDVAMNTLDEWIYFLKHNAIEDNFKAKGLDKAREALVRDNLTEEERREYDYLMRVRSENRSAYASAIDEGIIEGELRARSELEPRIAEKNQALAEKEQALARERAEKEQALAEKEQALAEKEQALARERAEKEQALAEKEALAAELAALKSKFKN